MSTDLIDRGFGHGGHDFLKSTTPLAKNIITNPPYGTHGLGDAFVRRALIHARKTGGSVAMLLNLRSLCNPDRTPRFQRCPPTAIYVLDELTCWPEGSKHHPTSALAVNRPFVLNMFPQEPKYAASGQLGLLHFCR